MGGEVTSDIFLQAMQQDNLKKSEPDAKGVLKKGKVVAISDSDIFLDLGSKSECIAPLSEFKEPPAIGDMIDIVIKDTQDGVNIASHLEALKQVRINDLKKAFEENLPVTGTIDTPIYKDGVPKGFNVNLGFDIKAFLPLSQIDARKEEKLENMKGTVLDFAMIEMKRNNITVSRREFLRTTVKVLYKIFFEKHKEGDKVSGKVERIEKDFAVLNVEGINAFLHVSDFSWKYLADMRNVVKTGDEIEALVIKLDPPKNFIKISRKPLIPNPWDGIEKKFSPGDSVKGKVVNFRKDGAMVELDDGIEAFLSVEEMSWTAKVRDPRKFVALGTIVEVKITDVDPEKRKIDISLRAVQENPWETAAQTYTYGKKIKGFITSIVDFGLFIRLEDGIEGLMRKEDVDWLETNIDLKKKFNIGDPIEAIVLSMDANSERLRLGYKQLSENPYQAFALNYPKGSGVGAVVKSISENGITVTLDNNVEGFIHISQDSKEKISSPAEAVKEGETIKAVIRSVDPVKLKVELSIKEYILNEEKIESSKYLAKGTKSSGMVTMGDMLKDQFANIKVENNNEPKKSKVHK